MWITLNKFWFKIANQYHFTLKNHDGYLDSESLNNYYYNCCYGIKCLYLNSWVPNKTMYLICG